MGYDLYGVNPRQVDMNNYPLLVKWEDKSFDERQEMPEEDRKEYWDQMQARDTESGEYFRANVWWWRRLWMFTCYVCEDVMTEDEMSAGDANDGMEITEETCAKMLPLMREALKDGKAIEYEKAVKEYHESVPKDKNGWIKNDDDFMANYPFTVPFFEEFITFVERSGGFTVS